MIKRPLSLRQIKFRNKRILITSLSINITLNLTSSKTLSLHLTRFWWPIYLWNIFIIIFITSQITTIIFFLPIWTNSFKINYIRRIRIRSINSRFKMSTRPSIRLWRWPLTSTKYRNLKWNQNIKQKTSCSLFFIVIINANTNICCRKNKVFTWLIHINLNFKSSLNKWTFNLFTIFNNSISW